ncbi:MAG: hypothetical protein LLF76_14490 [Planctomycetaceae bacterium]|nr:hypothetical protein [Planctomycetaceae bacterium]
MKKRTFNDLVLLARQELLPPVNVADRVIASLTGLGVQTADVYRPYVWMGVASAAIAACIAIAATVAWQGQADSVSEMLTYISWVAL